MFLSNWDFAKEGLTFYVSSGIVHFPKDLVFSLAPAECP